MATAAAVRELLEREAAKPGSAWVSIDDHQGGGSELQGCEVAAGALAILEDTLLHGCHPAGAGSAADRNGCRH